MIQEKILELLQGLPEEVIVAIISAIPVIEVRGAIPIGIALFDMPPVYTAVISLISSMIPVPFILLAIVKVLELLKKTKFFNKFALRLEGKSSGKKADAVRKYGTIGLVMFVAIPLPGTGVWSGSLIAALLGIKFKWAFPAILAGDIIATILVTLISTGLIHIF